MSFVSNNFVKLHGYSSDSDAQPNLFKYNALADLQATVEAAGYFDSIYLQLKVNDLLYLIMADGAAIGLYYVSDITAGVVTISGFATIGAGGVGAAQLDTDAVTTVKIADDNVTTAKLADNAVTSAKTSADLIQYAVVTLSAANIAGMYAAPVVLIAAGGADTIHRIKEVELVCDFGAAQYTAGGVFTLQYDSTANGAGTAASATTAAAVINGWAADSTLGVAGASANAAASTKVNKGIYASNQTQAFATGDSVVDVHMWYATITAGL